MTKKSKTEKEPYRSYAEKLRDPRWQMYRLKVMERDKATCRYCRAKDKTLNVHHKWYEKGRDPWDYPLDALITLCEQCHEITSYRCNYILRLSGSSAQRQIQTMRLLEAANASEASPLQSPNLQAGMDALLEFLGNYQSLCLSENAEDALDMFADEQDMTTNLGEMAKWFSAAIMEAREKGREEIKKREQQ